VSKQKLLPRCFEIFFRHPWNGLVHNAVFELTSKVISGVPDALRPALLADLLRGGNILERLVSEYEAEEKHGPPGSARHSRTGYMAHLHALCSELREYGMKFPECDAVLGEVSGWANTILPALDANRKITSEALGGGIHDGDRGLASSNAMPSGDSSTADHKSSSSDFVLDDLDDFDGTGGPLTLRADSGVDSDDEEEEEDRERLRRLGATHNDGFDPGFDPGSSAGSQDFRGTPAAQGASVESVHKRLLSAWNEFFSLTGCCACC
jgi:hypothetical protein